MLAYHSNPALEAFISSAWSVSIKAAPSYENYVWPQWKREHIFVESDSNSSRGAPCRGNSIPWVEFIRQTRQLGPPSVMMSPNVRGNG
ncbi:hypothetical protein N7519_006114 [Penicillium mononematosum]|uniref:uncharacterized protein n=1 Tax=Penicillium mononematosum TaxID=268346 RepID=UPI002548C3B0|nr:uncharacterized protein N7519_006114 [Penicillium mononematosum]KAJ6184813.1 hypothetical protein N7519_006114 [Penicillium mononematosum]